MAYRRATRNRFSTGNHDGNLTVGEYVGRPLPRFGKVQWSARHDEIAHSIKAAKKKHIECRYKKTDPFMRSTRADWNKPYTLNGYGYAVDLKTGSMGYGNYAHEALHALYAGMAYAKEMSRLIVEAYLSGGSPKEK